MSVRSNKFVIQTSFFLFMSFLHSRYFLFFFQTFKLYTKDPSWLNRTLETLRKTGNGIVFPYTPTINVNHSANYGTYDINQSVEQPHYYSMTPNVSIQLTAVFTANTAVEAEYMLACMHFLRTSTKSDFGAYRNGIRRNDAGTPPPVLVFSLFFGRR